MNTYITVSLIITFFASGLSFLMAVEQLMRIDRSQNRFLFFFFLVSTGVFMMGVGMVTLRIPIIHPVTVFLFTTSIFCIGPLDFLYFHTLLEPKTPWSKRLLVHFIPAGPVLLFDILVQIWPGGFAYSFIKTLLENPLNHWFSIVMALGALHVCAYLVYLLHFTLAQWNNPEVKSGVRIVAFIDLATITGTMFIIVGFLIQNTEMFLTGAIIDGLLHIVIFLTKSHYPNFFQALSTEIQKNKYEKSLIKDIDTDGIFARLFVLMTEEHIYEDPDLSLNSLAERLNIKPHQLSQFINEILDQNFRSYINTYRIEKAKELLTDPSLTILSIGFEVGFSSKSGFNQAFKKITGVSPSDYRTGQIVSSPLSVPQVGSELPNHN